MLRLRRTVGKDKIAQIAKYLDEKFPTEDPSAVKPSRLKKLYKDDLQKDAADQILAEWRRLFEARLHDTAYEDMADPGELCDGELPSWEHARLSVEQDPSIQVPYINAHEATIESKKKKSYFFFVFQHVMSTIRGTHVIDQANYSSGQKFALVEHHIR